MRSKCEVEEKQEGEGNLTAKPSEFRVSCLRVTAVEWGNPSVNPLFYRAQAPVNLASSMQIYLFTPTITSHNGKISKGQSTSFTLASVSVGRPWEFRSPFFFL
jgi:hypothetical protein